MDWMGFFVGTNSGDDCVHVDAQVGEIHHILHGSDTSNCCLPFRLMGVGKVHELLIDQTLVTLGKENGWLDRICLRFETGNLLCSKISLKDLRCKGFWNDSDQD